MTHSLPICPALTGGAMPPGAISSTEMQQTDPRAARYITSILPCDTHSSGFASTWSGALTVANRGSSPHGRRSCTGAWRVLRDEREPSRSRSVGDATTSTFTSPYPPTLPSRVSSTPSRPIRLAGSTRRPRNSSYLRGKRATRPSRSAAGVSGESSSTFATRKPAIAPPVRAGITGHDPRLRVPRP